MLLAAVTRNAFPVFLVYCLTGVEEYWTTIKPGRLLELYVERRMVSARMPNFDVLHTCANYNTLVVRCVQRAGINPYLFLSVRLPTVQLATGSALLSLRPRRIQYVFLCLSKQSDSLVHYTALQSNTSVTTVEV
jgi:hypothetical protein